MANGVTEREIFPGPLGEIVEGISEAAKAAGSEYQDILGIDSVLISGLLEQRDRLRNNVLGRSYRVWQDSPAGSIFAGNAWRWFVKEYQRTQVAYPDGEVTFQTYSGVNYVELPRIPSNEVKRMELVTNWTKVHKNADLQTSFARTLGVLEEKETWEVFMNRPGIRLVRMNGYKEAVAVIEEDAEALVRMDHPCKDGTMVEFPFASSKKYPSIAVDLRFFPAEKGLNLSFDQLLKERRFFLVTSMWLASDLLLKNPSSRLQTPIDRDRFQSDLYQLISKA